MTEDKALSIAFDKKATQEAIANLIKGKTPVKYIKQRPGRGGGSFNYVETYYVVDQLNKLFGFRWDFDVIEEKVYDKEVTVKGKLTCYGADGHPIVKTQYGSVDRQTGVPLGDTQKGAASDCIKKCASLIGIALDVYWGKELEYFAEPAEGETVTFSGSEAMQSFTRFLQDKKITWSEASGILKTANLADITNYKEAIETIKKAKGIQ